MSRAAFNRVLFLTAQQIDNFKKAFSVCLEAKNYMVKF